MLELHLLDGKKSFVPVNRILSIQEDANGNLVVAVDIGAPEPQWHNISGFSILREGQRIQG
jgi:hypothetical protein